MHTLYSHLGSLTIGPYPDRTRLNALLDRGVDVFVNLCSDDEVILHEDYTVFVHKHKKTRTEPIIHHVPISPRGVTSDETLLYLTIRMWDLISNGRHIYIHGLSTETDPPMYDNDGRVIVLCVYFMMYVMGSDDTTIMLKYIQHKIPIESPVRLSRSQSSQIRRYHRAYARGRSHL
jgi:hypothetical protein